MADLGYRDVWSAEVDGTDGFTPLALAAAWEPRLDLGVAVTPAFTRGPGLLAMSIASIAEAAPGRFSMGLGSSSFPVVERWNGIPYEKPYAKTRDVLRFVKRALDGEKIDEVFETFEVHGFKLARPVAVRPEILLGALRPGMLRLAGREADGAILNWLGANDVAQCRNEVGEGKTIAARIFVIPTTDKDTARFIARRMISSYLTVEGYAEFHRWLGRTAVSYTHLAEANDAPPPLASWCDEPPTLLNHWDRYLSSRHAQRLVRNGRRRQDATRHQPRYHLSAPAAWLQRFDQSQVEELFQSRCTEGSAHWIFTMIFGKYRVNFHSSVSS